PLQAERGQEAGDLADAPLDGVHPVAAVRDVRGADVLARGEQVLHPDRDQRAERDAQRRRAEVDVVAPPGRRVEVDRVPASDAEGLAGTGDLRVRVSQIGRASWRWRV